MLCGKRLSAILWSGSMKRLSSLLLLVSCLIWITYSADGQAQDIPTTQHLVVPGDTWTVLGWRYRIDGLALQRQFGHINRQREPAGKLDFQSYL